MYIKLKFKNIYNMMQSTKATQFFEYYKNK